MEFNRFNFNEIKQAQDKEELNQYLINNVFKNYKSKEHLKHIEFIQLLEANQEAYYSEEPEILNNVTQYFTHELIIPEIEITQHISEQLIEYEHDFIFNEMDYYKFHNISYDIVLEKNIFTYFMEEVGYSDPDFKYDSETHELIITDLFNFLYNTAENNNIFFNSETKQDLIESIAEEIAGKLDELNLIPEFEYYYMVYSAGKDTYIKVNTFEELQILNQQQGIIERELKRFLIYNDSATTTFEDQYILLTKALLTHTITTELLNPILNYIPNYYECKTVHKLLNNY